MELFVVVLCVLLTAADGSGSGVVTVKEGRDVVLPCSLSSKEIERFEWKKDGGGNVFRYEAGTGFGSAFTDQDAQFKDRVSHFPEALKDGTFSIKINQTKASDSGTYTCEFPRLQPPQTFRVQLDVCVNLRDRSEENIQGAFSKLSTKRIKTPDKKQALLHCTVQGSSTKAEVQWRDSSGKTLDSEEKKTGNIIILQTDVTETDTYRCVVTQREICHEVQDEIYVDVYKSPVGLIVAVIIGWILAVVLLVVLVVLEYPCFKSWMSNSKTEGSRNANDSENTIRLQSERGERNHL